MKKVLIFVTLFAILSLVVTGCSDLLGGLGEEGPTVTSVTVAPTSASIDVGKTVTLTATVTYSDNSKDSDVRWSSSDESVVTVSSGGIVTGIAPGSVTVTSTSNRDSSKSSISQVTVTSGDITWTMKTPMPTGRALFAVGVVNNKIYAIGGADISSPTLNTVEEYDPATDRWVEKSPMPTARRELTVGVVGGKIYALGGYDGSSYLTTVEEYDPATDQWTAKASMPAARVQFAVSVVKDKIYAIGGQYTINIEKYDPATDQWSDITLMPVGQYGFAAGVVNNKIYTIGGTGGRTEVEEFDPETDQWTTRSPMPTGRTFLAVGVA